MTLNEYIAKAKAELDTIATKFQEKNAKNPDMWPLEMNEEEWKYQELFFRF